MNYLPSGLKEVLREPDSDLQCRIYYLECLAHASYMVLHDGKAVLVDPRRDVEAYVKELEELGASLIGVLETHFHADFVSGHYELHKRFNVPVYFGPGAGERAKFPLVELKDGTEVALSLRYSFTVLHTPGHTPESICYLLVDKERDSTPLKLFTGDTLFIGSCGRPDLVGSLGHTAEGMAQLMFDSLNRLKGLPGNVQVLPAHGAGSPCGKNLSSKLHSTIAEELDTNAALQFEKKDEFVTFLTSDPQDTPQYFLYDVTKNVEGAPELSEELSKVVKLQPLDFMKEAVQSDNFVILDTRKAIDFSQSYIPKALNVPIGSEGGVVVGPEDGNFSIWVGTMVSQNDRIGLVTPPGREEEALERLGRIGYTNVVCVLQGGMEEWRQSGYPTHSFTKLNLAKHPGVLEKLIEVGCQVVDVRTTHEYRSNNVKDSLNIPLPKLPSSMDKLDNSKLIVCYCKGGFRSAIACSLLLKAGFNAQDIVLGFAAVSVYSPTVTSSGEVCPTMQSMVEAAQQL